LLSFIYFSHVEGNKLRFPVNVSSQIDGSYRQVQYNTIADIWVHYEFPEPELPSLDYRRNCIKNYLLGIQFDMLSVAEATQSELAWLSTDPELSAQYFFYLAPFNGKVWCNWVRSCGWEPNGVIVGLSRTRFDISKSYFFTVPQVSGFQSGVSYAFDRLNSQYIVFLAMHLDTDSELNQEEQVKSVIEFARKYHHHHVFIGGDLNFEYPYNPFADLSSHGFTDALAALTPSNMLPTNPIGARMDGIFYRCAHHHHGEQESCSSLFGAVSDNGVCDPNSPNYIPDMIERFFFDFLELGSDHFPIYVQIQTNKPSSKWRPWIKSHMHPTCQSGLKETAQAHHHCREMPTCGCGPCCAPSEAPCVPDDPTKRGLFPTPVCCAWLQQHFYTAPNGSTSPVPGCP